MLERIGRMLVVPKKDRAEFSALLNKYNNTAGSYFAAISVMLLIFAIGFIWWLSTCIPNLNSLFEKVVPVIIALFAASVITAFVVWLVRKQAQPMYWMSEIVIVLDYLLFVVVTWYCFELDASFSQVRASALPAFLLFVPVFFMRFPLTITFELQTIVTVFFITMSVTSPVYTVNLYSCIIYLAIAYVLSVFGACVFWSANLKSYLSEKNYESLLTSDFLTKVYNRRGFDSIYSRVWDDAVRKDAPLTLLIADIDYFKKYNDIYGHIEGDQCIVRVANSIATSVRVNDYVARYGGEEFVVVMSEADNTVAEAVSQRIAENMWQMKIPHAESVEPYVTVSIGVATVYPAQQDITPNDLLGLADASLYRAKANGRNRIEFSIDAKNYNKEKC